VSYRVFGDEKKRRLAVMRATDAESLQTAVLFHDPGIEIRYRVNWYPSRGKAVAGDWQPLDSSYLVLSPPAMAN
jgi:hypothetical protein